MKTNVINDLTNSTTEDVTNSPKLNLMKDIFVCIGYVILDY